MHYRNGIYNVDVGPEGAIKVKPGDWLSKYSAAIHNDFIHIYEFARKNHRTRAPVPIQDVNMIIAGETLYHLPTYYSSFAPMIVRGHPAEQHRQPPQQRHMSDAQKKRLIEQSLSRQFNLRGDRLHIVSEAIDILGYTENAMTLAEIAGLVAEGGAVAGAATALSILNIFLFPIGATIAIINAWEFGERLTGMRAVAYGTTAWAFGDQMPPLPPQIRSNIITGGYGQAEASRHASAWNEARDSAVRALEQQVRSSGKSKRSHQVLLRAIGDDDRNKLVRKLMQRLADSLRDGMEKGAFWSPEPHYPN